MNTVLIFTDTQRKDMVGCYGQPVVDTPNLDRLASQGIRFERAYTACPLCTPARGSIFTGLHPASCGAWGNSLPIYRHVPVMGEIARRRGVRAAHVGKWHLDGTHYNGTGQPDGGFEPDWWYDRANFLAELPPNKRELYRLETTVEDLRREGLGQADVYGHRVTDRAIDFLKRVGDEPFVLSVAYDEPHDPWIAPPDYWEKFNPGDIPGRPNFGAPLGGKPRLQQVHARDIEHFHGSITWEQLVAKRLKFYGCNSYIDREIGRLLEAIDRLHGDDTLVIYTSDHGDMLGSHGQHDKGPMMYEEVVNVPFIVRGPGVPRGAVSDALVSQLDILPTILDYAGVSSPGGFHGASLRPVLEDPAARVHEHVMISFHRFARAGCEVGGFYPIRCVTDGRWKLAINLLDTDELYDLAADPYEMVNRIDDPACRAVRDDLHDRLLAEMARTGDPMDNWLWGDRPRRRVRQPRYYV